MSVHVVWLACAVQVPPGSGVVGATDQCPATAVAVSVRDGVPVAPIPRYSLTVIAGWSPAAVPARPENTGLVWSIDEQAAGAVSVTFGDVAITVTVNVFGALPPRRPTVSVICARAV